MKPVIRTLITIGILIILVISFYYASKTISEVTGKSILGWLIKTNVDRDEDEKLDNFAKCLTDKGAVLYIKNGCRHCKAQEEDFGTAIQYLKIVECTEQIQLCEEKQLIRVPAWEIDGKLYYGRTELQDLAKLAGCEY